jgi:hypothetical protein
MEPANGLILSMLISEETDKVAGELMVLQNISNIKASSTYVLQMFFSALPARATCRSGIVG